jgi:hypothetical protein
VNHLPQITKVFDIYGNLHQNANEASHLWLIPVILATQEDQV